MATSSSSPWSLNLDVPPPSSSSSWSEHSGGSGRNGTKRSSLNFFGSDAFGTHESKGDDEDVEDSKHRSDKGKTRRVDVGNHFGIGSLLKSALKGDKGDSDDDDEDNNKSGRFDEKKTPKTSDPFFLNIPKLRSRRVIDSAGRPNPISGQAEIAERIALNPDLYNERKQTPPNQAVAPLGNPDDFQIREGDILFGMKRVGGGGRASTNGFPDIVGFTTTNGLPLRTKIFHIGQCKNRAGVGREEMNCVTAVVAGSATYVNNGDETINPGDDIIWSIKPNTVGEGLNLKPKVQVKGQPVTKFIPTFTVYRHGNASLLIEQIKRKQAEAEFDANYDPTISLDTRYAKQINKSNEFFGKWGNPLDPLASLEPIQIWAKWSALEKVVRMAVLWVDPVAACKVIQKIMGGILDDEITCYDNDESVHELLKTRGAMLSELGLEALAAPKESNAAFDKLMRHIPDFIARRCAHSLSEHIEFMRSHIIGTALTQAVTGKSFDIKLGYFHR